MNRKPDTRSFTSNVMYSKQLREFTAGAMVTMFATVILAVYLSPFAYMVTTSFKTKEQIVNGEILPLSPRRYVPDPATLPAEALEQIKLDEVYDVYKVPVEGVVQEWALVDKGREESFFIDPADPQRGLIQWTGRWRTLDAATEWDLQFENFETAWEGINFPRLLFNTFMIAVIGLIGTLMSSIAVAYGFARFPIPGKDLIFMILIGTIILPRQVTLVPTYAFFSRIGWTGSWLPLLVPHFFANAYNVFLLRQFFRTLPKELDEAAMIDGAGPFRILVSVIIPQSYPAIVAVALFHFVFAWNDYFEPLIYTLGRRDLVPISVGIQQFNFIYDQQPHLIQATSLMGLALPVLLFFFAQRVFMRGIVVTGVDK